MFGGQDTGGYWKRETQEQHWQVCMDIPPVPAGLCKPAYKAVSWYEKLAKWIHIFTREIVLGRDIPCHREPKDPKCEGQI